MRIIWLFLLLAGLMIFLPGCKEKEKEEAEESGEVEGRLEEAAARGDLAPVKKLIQRGDDVNAANALGETPLHKAAEAGHKTVVQHLIARGAKVNAKTTFGKVTPLHLAASEGHEDVVEVLLAKGAEVDARDFQGNTPLYEAVEMEQAEVVKVLLSNGADREAANNAGRTPLIPALRNDLVYDLLMRYGTIQYAAEMGNLEEVKSIVKKNPALADDKGREQKTPLYFAVANNHKAVAEFLVGKGADPTPKRALPPISVPGSLPAGEDYMPLFAAVKNGRKDMVELLLTEKADINAKCLKTGDTTLHKAVSGGHSEIAEVLLSRGADVNATNKRQFTPLHEAVVKGDLAIVKALVNKGADVNAKAGAMGYTPLRPGLRVKVPQEIAAFLREHGAR